MTKNERIENLKQLLRYSTTATLYEAGFDTSVRLAPCLHNTVDFDKINNINCDKILVEFLRITNIAQKSLKHIININEYTVNEGNSKHLPLQKKLEILSKIHYKELTVCEDVKKHYDYFMKFINHNPNDCCNLNY